METLVFGAVRPSSESCDDRGKRPKQETEFEAEEELEKEPEEEESKSESESDSEPEDEWARKLKFKVEWDWQSHTLEEVKEMYEDEPYPCYFGCSRFVFKNKVKREQEEACKKAVAEYLQMSNGISPYDAIPVPSDANYTIHNFTKPLHITEDSLPLLTHLSKLALEDYNTKNDKEYEFAELVKVTHKRLPLGTYYITFKANPKDATDVAPSNCSAATFQAHVVKNITGDVDIEYCSIKT